MTRTPRTHSCDLSEYSVANLTQSAPDEGAELTIVAAAGFDSGYGLSGVSRVRRSQRTFELGHYTFVAVESPKHEVHSSKWNTRAWTFQEALLSRRCLVFTETQCYFQCRQGHRVESIDPDVTIMPLDQNFEAFPERGLGSIAVDIYDRIQEYYRKELSYDADILNAISGILRAFQRTLKSTHFYGIPIMFDGEKDSVSPGDMLRYLNVSLAVGLAWQVVDCRSQKVHQWYRPDASSSTFPSWTWAAYRTYQSKSDMGRLSFFYARAWRIAWTIGEVNLDEAIRIRLYHRSGAKMSLLEYIKHEDDYSAFHPCLELTSMSISGSVLHHGSDLAYFSACPNMVLQLQYHPEKESSSAATAVYVGSMSEPRRGQLEDLKPGKQLAFILIEPVTDRCYRRIGMLSYPMGKTWSESNDIGYAFGRICNTERWYRKSFELV
jgi:hypothetical protein